MTTAILARHGRPGLTATAAIPELQDVIAVEPGKPAFSDCWGKEMVVDEIIYRGIDIHGKAYVGVMFRDGSGRISGSLKHDRLCLTVPLTQLFTDAECDTIQRLLRTNEIGAIHNYIDGAYLA